jgi:TRAP-type C4-dicarboxylate transport system permease small subunit
MSSRVKLCGVCGGVMRKSSRRILSVPAGIILIILGSFLMGGYGFFTNFYQAPWFVRFALPAMYYIGSILIGVGLLFFFIRENVWRCVDCKEMTQR